MAHIPPHISLIRDFVNTVELDEVGSDTISTPGGLQAWLSERGLTSLPPSRADVARTAALREALRTLLMANNGLPVDTGEARTVMENAARRAGVELRFDPTGSLVPEPTREGTAAALGAIVAAASLSMQDGTWARLKACRADTCHWAFYDQARNRSRAWCSMEVCGNRAKVRSYRRRHATA